jgi:hypothetical protein
MGDDMPTSAELDRLVSDGRYGVILHHGEGTDSTKNGVYQDTFNLKYPGLLFFFGTAGSGTNAGGGGSVGQTLVLKLNDKVLAEDTDFEHPASNIDFRSSASVVKVLPKAGKYTVRAERQPYGEHSNRLNRNFKLRASYAVLLAYDYSRVR